jgi:hypothetical protein
MAAVKEELGLVKSWCGAIWGGEDTTVAGRQQFRKEEVALVAPPNRFCREIIRARSYLEEAPHGPRGEEDG